MNYFGRYKTIIGEERGAMAELFGTDGIRGLANTPPVDAETGLRLGRAVVEFCRRRGRKPHIVIGRDTRISGEMLEYAVVSGVLSAGGAVSRAGEIPTPAIAYLARALGLGAGIVISASHNPYEYNGFKIFSGEGFKLSEGEESEIEELIIKKDAVEDKKDPGRVEVLEGARDLYLSFLMKTLPDDFNLRDMKIVL
ncbi:MAG: phosphoglucosamine mutase, partial [Pseudomonadota bacterium]